jgi:hypothetical protein
LQILRGVRGSQHAFLDPRQQHLIDVHVKIRFPGLDGPNKPGDRHNQGIAVVNDGFMSEKGMVAWLKDNGHVRMDSASRYADDRDLRRDSGRAGKDDPEMRASIPLTPENECVAALDDQPGILLPEKLFRP